MRLKAPWAKVEHFDNTGLQHCQEYNGDTNLIVTQIYRGDEMTKKHLKLLQLPTTTKQTQSSEQKT